MSEPQLGILSPQHSSQISAFPRPLPAVAPLLALLSPVRRRVSSTESRAVPLSTLLQGAPSGAAGAGGLQGLRSEAPTQKCFWTSLSVSGLGTEGRKNVSQMGGDGLDMWFSDETDMGAAHLHQPRDAWQSSPRLGLPPTDGMRNSGGLAATSSRSSFALRRRRKFKRYFATGGRPGVLCCWEPSNFWATSLRCQAKMVPGLTMLATSSNACFPTCVPIRPRLCARHHVPAWGFSPPAFQNRLVRGGFSLCQVLRDIRYWSGRGDWTVSGDSTGGCPHARQNFACGGFSC